MAKIALVISELEVKEDIKKIHKKLEEKYKDYYNAMKHKKEFWEDYKKEIHDLFKKYMKDVDLIHILNARKECFRYILSEDMFLDYSLIAFGMTKGWGWDETLICFIYGIRWYGL